MSLLRSERFPALLLLIAAVVGLILANGPLQPAIDGVLSAHFGIEGFIDLSTRHWISDALLAVFFFVVAVELQFELTRGELAGVSKALQPAIAAAGGVIVPIIVYLMFTAGTDVASGWPIPTATDIAFALGVLAVFGKGLPSGVRIFLLALAILDDIVGIVFIAVLFTTGIEFGYLFLAVLTLVAFGVVSRVMRVHTRVPMGILLLVLGIATWVLVYKSGVHATIAGVALGLAMSQTPALRVRHILEPWINGLVLPIFAFSAAFVVIPAVSPTELSPAFWGVLVALPVGKIIGITIAGWIAQRVAQKPGMPRLPLGDLIAAGTLGGIGFTVSLLLSELAFAGAPEFRDQATLGVLAGSGISVILAGIIISWRAAHYRRIAAKTQAQPE